MAARTAVDRRVAAPRRRARRGRLAERPAGADPARARHAGGCRTHLGHDPADRSDHDRHGPRRGADHSDRAPHPGVPTRSRCIGDSVMVGAATAIEQALGPVRIDAAVNRQFGTAIELLTGFKNAGQLSDTVVVHMGTNGVITQDQMNAMMEVLKDRKRVVFLNLKVPRRWEQGDNDVLASTVAKFPNAVLIDWHNIGNAHPEYFYEDGIHLRPDGARAYAELIRQQTDKNP